MERARERERERYGRESDGWRESEEEKLRESEAHLRCCIGPSVSGTLTRSMNYDDTHTAHTHTHSIKYTEPGGSMYSHTHMHIHIKIHGHL